MTPWTIQSMEFSRPEYWSGQPFPSPGDLPNPGIELRSLALQVDSFPAEPQGKPRNTGVGSLSLLQRIFPTQESNQGLLHCRRILYQLSYHGSWCVLVLKNKNSVYFLFLHSSVDCFCHFCDSLCVLNLKFNICYLEEDYSIRVPSIVRSNLASFPNI